LRAEVLLVDLQTVHPECFVPDHLERRGCYSSFNVPHKKNSGGFGFGVRRGHNSLLIILVIRNAVKNTQKCCNCELLHCDTAEKRGKGGWIGDCG
jgi:hypothetical protein